MNKHTMTKFQLTDKKDIVALKRRWVGWHPDVSNFPRFIIAKYILSTLANRRYQPFIYRTVLFDSEFSSGFGLKENRQTQLGAVTKESNHLKSLGIDHIAPLSARYLVPGNRASIVEKLMSNSPFTAARLTVERRGNLARNSGRGSNITPLQLTSGIGKNIQRKKSPEHGFSRITSGSTNSVSSSGANPGINRALPNISKHLSMQQMCKNVLSKHSSGAWPNTLGLVAPMRNMVNMTAALPGPPLLVSKHRNRCNDKSGIIGERPPGILVENDAISPVIAGNSNLSGVIAVHPPGACSNLFNFTAPIQYPINRTTDFPGLSLPNSKQRKKYNNETGINDAQSSGVLVEDYFNRAVETKHSNVSRMIPAQLMMKAKDHQLHVQANFVNPIGQEQAMQNPVENHLSVNPGKIRNLTQVGKDVPLIGTVHNIQRMPVSTTIPASSIVKLIHGKFISPKQAGIAEFRAANNRLRIPRLCSGHNRSGENKFISPDMSGLIQKNDDIQSESTLQSSNVPALMVNSLKLERPATHGSLSTAISALTLQQRLHAFSSKRLAFDGQKSELNRTIDLIGMGAYKPIENDNVQGQFAKPKEVYSTDQDVNAMPFRLGKVSQYLSLIQRRNMFNRQTIVREFNKANPAMSIAGNLDPIRNLTEKQTQRSRSSEISYFPRSILAEINDRTVWPGSLSTELTYHNPVTNMTKMVVEPVLEEPQQSIHESQDDGQANIPTMTAEPVRTIPKPELPSMQVIADKVYRILERKLQIERERRGIF